MRVNADTMGAMDAYEIRYRNLRMLIEKMEHDAGRGGFARAGGLAMLAEKLGKQQAQVNHFASESRVKNIGDKIARQIDEAFGKPSGWLDHPQWVADAANPVSTSDAIPHNHHTAGYRRVRIEGVEKMDDHGFWEVGSDEEERTPFPTDDPDAYGVRVTTQRFQPVMASGQCILVSPGADVKAGRPVMVTLTDGRRTLRTFLSHDRGVWSFTSVTDGNAYLDLPDAEVEKVERVMAYLWTD